ncbi:MAG: translocation/assembly module TamB domain-containing protein [Pacificimonas sp.]|jgi:translocation and assembly module TamB|nr:translocation/assembly module TamB domain-containing protein [Pacificimonas sp.]
MRRWVKRVMLAALLLPIILIAGVLFLTDTAPGRAVVISQFDRLSEALGVDVEAARLTGSLRGTFAIEDLVLADAAGPFFRSPRVEIDWRPWRYVAGDGVVIRSITANSAALVRLPSIDAPEETGAGTDIRIEALDITALQISDAVAADAPTASVTGRLSIASGAFSGAVRLVSDEGGDNLNLEIDANPARDQLRAEGLGRFPAGGLVAAALGIDRGVTLQLSGTGGWQAWEGQFRAQLDDDPPLSALRIAGTDGTFRLRGRVDPAALTGGIVERISPTGFALRGSLSVGTGRVPFILNARSEAAAIEARGALSRSLGTLFDGRLRIDLLQPAMLLSTLGGSQMQLTMRGAGPLAKLGGTYAFSSDWVSLGNQRLPNLQAVGDYGALTEGGSFSIKGGFDTLQGAGAFVADLMRGGQLTAPITLDGYLLTSNAARFSSDVGSASGRLTLNLEDGRYDIAADVVAPSYEIPAYGEVAYRGRLRLRPDPAQPRKLRVSGPSTIETKRLDNGFLAFLAGGFPTAEAVIDRGADGTISLTKAIVEGPGLSLTGRGEYRLGQQISAEASGRHSLFGPLSVELDGDLGRPKANLLIERYSLGLPITDIAASFAPDDRGYAVQANGSSLVGNLRLAGRIDLDPGNTVFRMTEIAGAGLTASGTLQSPTGVPVAGTLAIVGDGVRGAADFSPASAGRQRIAVSAALARASLGTRAELTVGRGAVDAAFLVGGDGEPPEAVIEAGGQGIRLGDVQLADAGLTYELAGGQGRLALTTQGRRGGPFAVRADVRVLPETISADLSGIYRGDPFELEQPARIAIAEDGYRMAEAILSLSEGTAALSGEWTNDVFAFDLALDEATLAPFSLVDPRFAAEGTVTGRITADITELTQSGEAELALRRFTRTTGVEGPPLDINLSGALEDNAAALSARVAGPDGEELGTARALMTGLRDLRSGPLSTITGASLNGALQFEGPAEAIWALTGVDAVAVSGPLTARIEAEGVVDDPVFYGSLTGDALRFESAASGTVIDGINLDGVFDGSTLRLARFTGTSRGGGTVEGAGELDLSLLRGFPFAIRLESDGAELVDIATLRARVSGDVIVSGAVDGGEISGGLTVDSARYRPDAAQLARIPLLAVREVGTAFTRAPRAVAEPGQWNLDVTTSGGSDILVRGRGLDSEWQVDFDLTGEATQPRLVGRASLIRGDYDFAGRRFDLTRGELDFQGDYPPDPSVSIDAEARIEGLTARIEIRGLSSEPQIRLSAVPALPEDEILARILFGSSLTNLNPGEAVQLAGALAAFQAGGQSALDPIGNLRDALGIDRLRVGGSEEGGTSIAAGEFIGQRTYVELGTDTRGETATQIEHALNRVFSVFGRVSTFGANSVGVRASNDY